MRYLFAMMLVFTIAQHAHAEEVLYENQRFSIAAGVGMMQGHTTYQIGGWVDTPEGSDYVRFPLSELKFPLDVAIGTFSADFRLNERWKFTMGIKTNLTSDAGKMKDSDWGIYYGEYDWANDPNALHVLSKTDADLEAFIADVSARFYFAETRARNQSRFLFFVGGMYIHHYFDFEVRNLDQWYPAANDYYGYEVEHDRVSGLVGTYEVTKHIPAMIFGVELFTNGELSFEALLGFSPIVSVEDEDHHLLREPVKVSKAECEGEAVLFSLAGNYRFNPNWSIDAKFDYISIETDGTEDQYDGGVFSASIDQKNFSDITTYEIGVRYSF